MKTKAIEFEKFSPRSGLQAHRIVYDGEQLRHYIDGELRASVDRVHFANYAQSWPQAFDVLPDGAALRRASTRAKNAKGGSK